MAAAIFEKWELDFAVIGEVTDTQHMVLEFDGEVVCDIPLGPLAADAPEYERPYLSKEEYKAWAKVKPLDAVPESTDIGADLLKMMASPALASRRWIAEQYDSQVGADTLQTGGDAGVVRVHGTKKALAITTDCTPRYVYADPYEGGKQAVAEAYRNLCAVGARPLAITNCLNFGNPQRPEIMAQFVHALEGMGDACRALDFPIVSGNVSLYNESKATGGGSAILPTPAIGGVGIIDDYSKMMTMGFKNEGDIIFLIGGEDDEILSEQQLGQSTWLREVHGMEAGTPPTVDLELELRAGQFVQRMITEGRVTAVHDVSDGGYVIAATEMALAGNKGAALALDAEEFDRQKLDLFAENQGIYVATAGEAEFKSIRSEAFANGLDCVQIGMVEGDGINFFKVSEGADEDLQTISLADLREAHASFFRDWMEA
jgi:phosphoribosylformylglycinamidine synthase